MTLFETPAPGPHRLPPAAGNIYRFQVSNALSWSMLLGFPMVLYFNSLGAPAVILGLAMGVPPLLTVLQVPAAGFVEKVGYRRMVFLGWSSRAFVAGGMVLVAVFSGAMEPALAVGLMMAGLVLFSLLRGIASSAILPWFTQLIPEPVRGRYLSLEQALILATALGTALVSSALFEWLPEGKGFSVVFGISFVGGFVALLFLRRIPDVPVPEEKRIRQRIPWKALFAHRSFRRLVLFDVVLILSWTGSGVAVVPMLQERFGIGDSEFMLVHAGFMIASIGTLLTLRSLIDRVGSKPLLAVALAVMITHYGGWLFLAGGVLPASLWVLAFTQGSWGIVHALFVTANSRLLMQIVPAEGRSHFFAFHTVGINLASGLFPVAWGWALDLLRGVEGELAIFSVNPYSILYLTVSLIPFIGIFLLRRIQEDRTMNFQEFVHEFLVRTPASALARFNVRRPRLR